jgi:MoaA/NifB/PqqE/SkfB family radical SAM enzyme
MASYQLTKWTGKAIQWGRPMTISIEPTTACNLRCPECPSGLRSFTRDTGNMKEDFFRKLIDDMHRQLMWLIFYFQGEPYINPKFLDMVNYAHRHGIYTITSTNGHFLHPENARRTVESGLDRILISIDGSTKRSMNNIARKAPSKLYSKEQETLSKQKRRRLDHSSYCFSNARGKT